MASEQSGGLETVLVVAAGQWAYTDFHRLSAYICQPGRFPGRNVERIAFYSDGEVKPEIPLVRYRLDNVTFSDEEAARLEGSGDPLERRCGEVIRLRVAQGGEREQVSQIFLLSGPQDPETVHLSAPIPHEGRGGWLQAHRWIPLAALQAGPANTEELDRSLGTDRRWTRPPDAR